MRRSSSTRAKPGSAATACDGPSGSVTRALTPGTARPGSRLLAAVEVVEDLGAPVERLGRLRVAARRRGVERDERLLGLASALEELAALELERGLLDGRRARHRLLEGARGGLVPAELPRAVGDDAERAKRNRGLTRLGHDPLLIVDCSLRYATP